MSENRHPIHTSGSCGNGLDCPDKSFQTVDCFSTLLTGQCIYGISNNAFFLAIFCLLVGMLVLCVCIYCLYCRQRRPTDDTSPPSACRQVCSRRLRLFTKRLPFRHSSESEECDDDDERRDFARQPPSPNTCLPPDAIS